MLRRILQCLAGLLAVAAIAAENPRSWSTSSVSDHKPADKPADPPAPASSHAQTEIASGKKRVVVIPVREQVDSPLLFIIRRGLKEAIEQKADVVVLDMKTPGGAADSTLEIMEALDKFPGRTITYVNDEAGSAGAIIAAITDEIYFAPNGVMGAAELIFGTGQDVPEGLKRKMNSYLAAKIRAFSGDQPMRSDVLEAMMNPDFELKIGDKLIKPKGKLLTLTAREATALYGDPPAPLLASGIATSVNDVLKKALGAAEFEVKTLEITWSERLAVFLRALVPLLLGIGLLALYIEFKTPGFGIFGIVGLSCLAVVFLSNFVAGLSGHEPMLVFLLGLLLVLVELFFFPGIAVLALSGLVLMLGSLIWSMADIWPNEPITFDEGLFFRPMRDLGLGVLVAVGLAVLLARFIPKSWIWSRLVLNSAVNAQAQAAGSAPEAAATLPNLVGKRGVAVTALFPSGQVEIDGQRFEARLAVGSAGAGTMVVVTGRSEFGLIVEVA